ncbi:hypothetical protein KIN20_010743 [Parelaphostrongylus tenuis]|uniref:Uncharacterized protein n=1 Tax=Parelaphostrongylus tenuis TaxID=148309 RepID=A0AAD5MA26_PARTN|nr:hypothetical protein KIN20_010743 [Parelaphostrongylus tenuis]
MLQLFDSDTESQAKTLPAALCAKGEDIRLGKKHCRFHAVSFDSLKKHWNELNRRVTGFRRTHSKFETSVDGIFSVIRNNVLL